jgi:hypothetical protein
VNFEQPVGLLLVAILHAIPDQDDPAGLVARLCAALAEGSYVAISHATADSRPAEVQEVSRLSRTTTTPVTTRSLDVVRQFFTGLSLVNLDGRFDVGNGETAPTEPSDESRTTKNRPSARRCVRLTHRPTARSRACGRAGTTASIRGSDRRRVRDHHREPGPMAGRQPARLDGMSWLRPAWPWPGASLAR